MTAFAMSKYAVPGRSGLDAALHADLDRAHVPRLLGAVGDLVQGEGVGVGVGAALGEGAEAAAGVADVGEVDVAGDDVGDVVADDRPAHVVGDPAQGVQGRAVGVEQGQGLVVGELGGVVGGRGEGGAYVGVDALGGHAGGGGLAQGAPVAVHLVEVVAAVRGAALGVDGGVQVGAAGGGEDLVRLLPGAALDGRVLAGQAGGRVGEGGHVRAQARVQPGLAALDELRVDAQAFAHLEAGGAGPGGEFVDLRPGAFGVDVVDGERGDAAPVVDAGADQPLVLGVHQIGRGLEAGGGAHDVPGDGHRGDQFVQFRVRHAAHRGVGLGAEVLDDQFLDAVVGAGDLAQREQGLGALLVGLADADQQTRGEGDGGAAGVLQDAQPDGRFLVRGAVVRAAGLGPQAGRGGLQHHAHGRRDGLEPLEVGPGQHARVEVGQQARLLQDADGDRADVGDRVVVAVRVEPLARLGPAVLGLVAEGDEGFLAAEGGALAGDVQHLVRRHEHPVSGAAQLAGDGDEGAVVALVPAQPGQRDEDALRVRDDAGAPGGLQTRVADPGGGRGEVGQVLAARLEQHGGLGDVEGDAVPGAFEGATQGVLGGARGAGSGGRGSRHPSSIRAA
ncbi:hypothetical protein ACVILE_003877 [Streptomyces sp. M18.1]